MEANPEPRKERLSALPAPDALRAALAPSRGASALIERTRAEIIELLAGRDRRLLVIVGPCSIHDPRAALEYAGRLVALRARFADELLICMRAYFEKPRTGVGWKGLLNDPRLDGSCDLASGLRLSRGLLLELAEMGVPSATETLDPLAPHYLLDLVAWSSIGARTSESQTHRELASGLGLPVGFKNGTDGGIEIAKNAMKAARAPHARIGIDGDGRASVLRTKGNPHTHLVLRGGGERPNYHEAAVRRASEQLRADGLNARVLIDCSHGNSQKNHANQALVVAEVARQLEAGSEHVLGVALESHLCAGRQELVPGTALRYGQSITDACIDFETTETLLRALAASTASSSSSSSASAASPGAKRRGGQTASRAPQGSAKR